MAREYQQFGYLLHASETNEKQTKLGKTWLQTSNNEMRSKICVDRSQHNTVFDFRETLCLILNSFTRKSYETE